MDMHGEILLLYQGEKSTTELQLFWGSFELLKIDFSTEEPRLALFIISAANVQRFCLR